MMRSPNVSLTPDEHVVVRRWTRCMLGAWIAVVAATMSLSLFGSDRSSRLPVAECSEMACLQVIPAGARRQ